MGNLRSNQEWKDHLKDNGVEFWVPIFVILVDLVNIFIAKSQFYLSWKPSFRAVKQYPKMLAWLNDNSGCESDSELWGEGNNKYSLNDLKDWLEKKNVAKGKRPAAIDSSAGKKREEKEGQESGF